jgi:biofilm PGA synthesis N-glycosyltransferase PgaC
MVMRCSGRLWVACLAALTIGACWLISNRLLEIRFFGLLQDLAVIGLKTYLAIFFAAVGLRYTVLICFSFMEHIDNQMFEKNCANNARDVVRPFISIVIPAFNEGLVIEQALRSLLRIDYPNYEILVIDDGSTDDTYERARGIARQEKKISIRVFAKPNGGKSDALNFGIARSRGEFVLNMDGDTVLSSNALSTCIRHFDDQKIGAVAGNVKVYNRENLLTRMQALEYIEGLAMARKAQSYVRLCNVIPGPLGMFRKSALVQVGGYDHDTFAEDSDVTLKLLLMGWQTAYEPTAIAWVETPNKALDLIKQRYRWSRGVLQAIIKHKNMLWNLKKGGINSFTLWYMLFENMIWPLTNVISNLVFIYLGINYGVLLLFLYWWIQLTVLDVIAAIYAAVLEKEDVSIVLYAPLFRIYYILLIDVAKVLANFEELFGIKMSWGKIERQGKL